VSATALAARGAARPSASPPAPAPPRLPPGLGRWLLRIAVVAWLTLLLLVPVGSVVWRALSPGPDAVWHAVTAPDALHALWLTLLVAAIAVPLNAAFGVGLALILARHRFPGAGLLGFVVDLPLAVSPVVIGVALLLLYGRQGWLGGWLLAHGILLVFSVPGIVIASAFVSLPYVAREVLPVLTELGTEQEQAAATLGAGALTIFRRITLPAIRYGLAYGVTLTTARVLGEFGAVSIVSGSIEGRTQTLTLYVADRLANFDPTGAYVGALVLCLVAVAVLGLLRLSRPKEERRPWPSTSTESASVSGAQSPSTRSTSPSRTAP
jgi:sulfate/thiosulfate transport system permease protein